MKKNPVKKNMDKFHKPRTHRDKTKYNRRTESERMQDDLEPIVHDWEDVWRETPIGYWNGPQ